MGEQLWQRMLPQTSPFVAVILERRPAWVQRLVREVGARLHLYWTAGDERIFAEVCGSHPHAVWLAPGAATTAVPPANLLRLGGPRYLKELVAWVPRVCFGGLVLAGDNAAVRVAFTWYFADSSRYEIESVDSTYDRATVFSYKKTAYGQHAAGARSPELWPSLLGLD
jgi:hypothetical protein